MSAPRPMIGRGFDMHAPGWNFLPRRRALRRTRQGARRAASISAVCAGALSATALAAWSAAADRRVASERTRLETDLASLATPRSAVRPVGKTAAAESNLKGTMRLQMDEVPGQLVDLLHRLGALAERGVSVERLTKTDSGAELTIRAHDGSGALRWFSHLVALPIAARAELVGIRAVGPVNAIGPVELKVRFDWSLPNAATTHAAAQPPTAVRKPQ